MILTNILIISIRNYVRFWLMIKWTTWINRWMTTWWYSINSSFCTRCTPIQCNKQGKVGLKDMLGKKNKNGGLLFQWPCTFSFHAKEDMKQILKNYLQARLSKMLTSDEELLCTIFLIFFVIYLIRLSYLKISR